MASVGSVSEAEKENSDKFFKYFLDRKNDLTWICFLPRRTTLDIAQKYSLLPKNGNIIAYEVPLDLIASDPNMTRKAFFSLIKDFQDEYKNKLLGKDIAFLGISVGSIPAVFLANRYKNKKIRIICSISKLGEGIFHSFAARKIKKDAIKNGFDEVAYDKILNEINLIENTLNLPDDVKIVISRFDNYIPYDGGVELIKKVKETKKNAKIYKFLMVGHFLTMLRVGWLNKKYNFLD